jgi:enterochelin esterase-like enzyme
MLLRLTTLLTLLFLAPLTAQERQRPPEVRSPEVNEERKVTFRIYAPQAKAVRVNSSDFPRLSPADSSTMKKADNGVWEATVGPLPAGAYRYHFVVDGLAVIDPVHGETSQSNRNTWSLVTVPGDTASVPHGAVAQVTYDSTTLKRPRRMHVYTPPGYEKGEGTYPVFYLLHGASDSDNSWNTVGQAGFILDKLIASGKARPMIVVMPNGHTGAFSFGGRGSSTFDQQMSDFGKEFATDIRPYIEKTYRTKTDRSSRAIAGLSMGGAQTLNIAFDKLEDYAYIGVYSSGVFGIAGGMNNQPPNKKWEESHQATLDNKQQKEGLKLVWFGCGKDDFLFKTSNATVDMLKSHGFDVTNHVTEGGHTWMVWRDYLGVFASKLFQ